MAKQSVKHYSQFNLFIRSLVFSVYMIFSISFFSMLVVFALVLPIRYRLYIVRNYLSHNLAMLKRICHIDYKIEGLENIPKDRVGIVFCKHQSTWETFRLPSLFPSFTVIVKRELLWIPFFGWAMAASKPIAINRTDKATSMQQIITKGKRFLDAGRWILMYPEGTRIPYGEIGQYKLGGARLAAATGYPVLPIAHNAGKFWGRRSFIKQPGTVTMVIGPLIESSGRTPEEIMALAKDWIETTVQKIKSDE